MKITAFSTILILVSLTAATPTITANGGSRIPTQAQAESFVNSFWTILTRAAPDPQSVASKLFTSDSKFYSGSLESLLGFDVSPIGTPFPKSLSSLSAGLEDLSANSTKYDYFIALGRQGTQHERNLFWHWQFDGVGNGGQSVRGFNCFSLRWEEGRWKAWRMSFEFDSMAWKEDQE